MDFYKRKIAIIKNGSEKNIGNKHGYVSECYRLDVSMSEALMSIKIQGFIAYVKKLIMT